MVTGVRDDHATARSDNALRTEEVRKDTGSVVAPSLAKDAGEIGQHSSIRVVFGNPIVGTVGYIVVILGIDCHPVGFSEAAGDQRLQRGLGYGSRCKHHCEQNDEPMLSFHKR
jgi:hypothetical protein